MHRNEGKHGALFSGNTSCGGTRAAVNSHDKEWYAWILHRLLTPKLCRLWSGQVSVAFRKGWPGRPCTAVRYIQTCTPSSSLEGLYPHTFDTVLIFPTPRWPTHIVSLSAISCRFMQYLAHVTRHLLFSREVVAAYSIKAANSRPNLGRSTAVGERSAMIDGVASIRELRDVSRKRRR